ncbi:MAG: helix-turn-helix domain-containing protein [Gammaproteobacteria bacterium]|nr:helix-turn-helix domain-containing protein [Gammaproteobacteria bacterium]
MRIDQEITERHAAFAKSVRRLRKDRKMTLKQVAEQASIDLSGLHKLERDKAGNTYIGTVFNLCRVYNVTPNELLGYDDNDMRSICGEEMIRMNAEILLMKKQIDLLQTALANALATSTINGYRDVSDGLTAAMKKIGAIRNGSAAK